MLNHPLDNLLDSTDIVVAGLRMNGWTDSEIAYLIKAYQRTEQEWAEEQGKTEMYPTELSPG